MRYIIAALTLIGALLNAGVFYPQTLVVDTAVQTETGEYAVTLHSGGGEVYEAMTALSDLIPGDMMAVLMYNGGTPEDTLDDTILAMRYTGFFEE